MPPAPPSPAQTPGAPVKGGMLRRVPRTVWLVAAGAGIGLAYVLYTRGSGGSVEDEIAMEEGYAAAGEVVPAASPVAYVTASTPSPDSGETVGAVGQTALETVVGLLTPVLEAVIEKDKPIPLPVATPPPGPASPPGQQPPVVPRPVPQPVTKPLPAGYHKGDTISGVSPLRKFPGAHGWQKVSDTGKGKKRTLVFRVAFATRIHRYRYDPGLKGKPWRKTAEGPR